MRFLSLPFFFFFNDTATTEIYTLSLHDALPIWSLRRRELRRPGRGVDARRATARAAPRRDDRGCVRRARDQDHSPRRAHAGPRPRARLRPRARTPRARAGGGGAARAPERRAPRGGGRGAGTPLPRRLRRRPRRRALLEPRRPPAQSGREVAVKSRRPPPERGAPGTDPRGRGGARQARRPARLRDLLARARGERRPRPRLSGGASRGPARPAQGGSAPPRRGRP